ncbi:hypothetical protein [Curtobacterium sp. MCSS17_016]|uniref:hypothetical protein n=1 Tax=Curtobacterium sp. MCSS17_016 TaxID=2175644 RepID=UPI0015E87AE0|nr:hypothetical protein [Curtobacterium sp. MCSS17_016]WIE81231.1 hypothetical protein DEJ19_018530 [Curtobacterium sp. MCSS17_016]
MTSGAGMLSSDGTTTGSFVTAGSRALSPVDAASGALFFTVVRFRFRFDVGVVAGRSSCASSGA